MGVGCHHALLVDELRILAKDEEIKLLVAGTDRITGLLKDGECVHPILGLHVDVNQWRG